MFEILNYLEELCIRSDEDEDFAEHLTREIEIALGIEDDDG